MDCRRNSRLEYDIDSRIVGVDMFCEGNSRSNNLWSVKFWNDEDVPRGLGPV